MPAVFRAAERAEDHPADLSIDELELARRHVEHEAAIRALRAAMGRGGPGGSTAKGTYDASKCEAVWKPTTGLGGPDQT